MATELPVFEKCCVCVPLRRGLILWGYFKLLIDALLLMLGNMALNDPVMDIMTFDVILTYIATVTALLDVIMNVVFIVGCHKKNLSIIRIFFIHSKFIFCLTIAFCVYHFVTVVYEVFYYNDNDMPFIAWVILLSSYAIIIFVQYYIILLVRSERNKLESNLQSTFTNNDVQPECTLKVEEIEGQKRKE